MPSSVTRGAWQVSDWSPDRASVRGEQTITYQIKDRELVWCGATQIESDENNFHYKHCRSVRENGKLIRERSWEDTIPRHYR